MPINADVPSLTPLGEAQQKLRSQLARMRRRLRRAMVLEVVTESLVVIVLAAAVLVCLDWWFRLGGPARIAWLALSIAAAVGFLGLRFRRRWRGARLDDLSLAVVLDRFRPGTGQHVADILQLPGLLDEGRAAASPALVRLAVQRASAALASSDWRELGNRPRTAAYLNALFLGLFVPTAFAVLLPDAARLSLARWLLGSHERWPQETYLTVMGLNGRGQLLAPRDEPLVLEVRADLPLIAARGNRWQVQGRDEPLLLRHKPRAPAAPLTVQVRERTAGGVWREGTMAAIGPGRYRYELAPAGTSSTLEMSGGDDWLGPITVERVDRPALADVKLRVKEPGAARAGFRTVADPRQHLLFQPDSEVELTLLGSQPLAGAQLKVNPGSSPDLGRVDARTFRTRWTLREATTLEIVLRASATGLDSRAAFLSMGLLRDREPRVTLRAQGVGSHVTPVATIPLALSATDDLGLAALRLGIERTIHAQDNEDRDKEDQAQVQEPAGDRPGNREPAAPTTRRATVALPLAQPGERAVLDQQVRHDVVLQADPPPIGTVIRMVGEADDRCPRGVQTGRSSVLVLQVVSADELFYEILIRQRGERAKFLALLESHEKLTPVLDGPSPPNSEDWNRLARLEQSSARQLEQVAGRLTDTLQEMKLNQVGSPKSHRLLQDEIIEPIRKLGSGPASALRNLVQTIASAGQSAPATRESARRLHHEVVTTMRDILAQMSQWESFVDVVNQVAEVIRMEQKVLQDTEKARQTRTREIFDDKP